MGDTADDHRPDDGRAGKPQPVGKAPDRRHRDEWSPPRSVMSQGVRDCETLLAATVVDLQNNGTENTMRTCGRLDEDDGALWRRPARHRGMSARPPALPKRTRRRPFEAGEAVVANVMLVVVIRIMNGITMRRLPAWPDIVETAE